MFQRMTASAGTGNGCKVHTKINRNNRITTWNKVLREEQKTKRHDAMEGALSTMKRAEHLRADDVAPWTGRRQSELGTVLIAVLGLDIVFPVGCQCELEKHATH
jgi:hypothetical protein